MPDDQALTVREEAPLSTGGALPEPITLLQVIQGAAANPNCDVHKLEALLRMAREEADREARTAFMRAMLDAQNEMAPIVRNAKNEDNKSRYATLERVDEAIGPIYKKHGLSLTFSSLEPKKEDNVRLRCMVLHRAGHSEPYELEGRIDTLGPKGTPTKTGIQGLGSSVSFIRRYLTMMIFNLIFTNDDNDGQLKAPLVSAQQASNITDLLAASEIKGDRLISFWAFAGARTAETIRADRYEELRRFLDYECKKIREGRR